jgi:hypothetical protein
MPTRIRWLFLLNVSSERKADRVLAQLRRRLTSDLDIETRAPEPGRPNTLRVDAWQELPDGSLADCVLLTLLEALRITNWWTIVGPFEHGDGSYQLGGRSAADFTGVSGVTGMSGVSYAGYDLHFSEGPADVEPAPADDAG